MRRNRGRRQKSPFVQGKDQRRSVVNRIPKRPIREPKVLCEAYHYPAPVAFSRGMRVELGECAMLFLSGTASVDENGQSIHIGDFEAQAQRTFSNLTALLESEGADWHDVVRTTCYLTDFRHYSTFNAIRNRFYSKCGLDPVPASTCVQAGLCRPELLVEIEAIAMLPRDRRPMGGPVKEAKNRGRSAATSRRSRKAARSS